MWSSSTGGGGGGGACGELDVQLQVAVPTAVEVKFVSLLLICSSFCKVLQSLKELQIFLRIIWGCFGYSSNCCCCCCEIMQSSQQLSGGMSKNLFNLSCTKNSGSPVTWGVSAFFFLACLEPLPKNKKQNTLHILGLEENYSFDSEKTRGDGSVLHLNESLCKTTLLQDFLCM